MGTERTIYVSFDDGARWQSLQGDLPITSMRDLVVHGDDIVVGTHGRSFWILDDITPLRAAAAPPTGSSVTLYTPATAIRVRNDTNPDTPLPPEEPVGENPPDGAIIDYSLGPNVTGPVRIAIADARGRVVRSFASTDVARPIDPEIVVPTYWVRPPAIPAATPGDHRFVWDLHESPPQALERGYPIAAIVHDTPLAPQGVLVVPGTYTVRLTAAGRTLSRTFRVTLDPRVTTSLAALRAQHALGVATVAGMNRSYALHAAALARHDGRAAARYAHINAQLGQLYDDTQAADTAPTAVAQAAVAALLVGVGNGGRTGVELPAVNEP